MIDYMMLSRQEHSDSYAPFTLKECVAGFDVNSEMIETAKIALSTPWPSPSINIYCSIYANKCISRTLASVVSEMTQTKGSSDQNVF